MGFSFYSTANIISFKLYFFRAGKKLTPKVCCEGECVSARWKLQEVAGLMLLQPFHVWFVFCLARSSKLFRPMEFNSSLSNLIKQLLCGEGLLEV
jgi:hypothetical protein